MIELNNTLYLIVGPSGAGKTTVANALCEQLGLTQIESYTTRPPRYEGERGHVFISDEEFDKLTDLVGYTEFNGYRYCATAEQVEKADLYVIDIAGVEYFKKVYKGSKKIKLIYIWVLWPVREIRMRMRGDSDEMVSERLKNDAVEFSSEKKEKLFNLFEREDRLLVVNNMTCVTVRAIKEFMGIE